jgi:tripartite-type tricarboxylate transporter receptor subunit TctC
LTLTTRRAALAAPALLLAPAARAQAFPSRELRLIVPFPPAGTTDVVARLVANAMREHLDGRAITVENVAGAGGMIGAQRFVRQGDDHTLFLSQIASNAIVPALQANAGYDPERDFRALSLVVTVPNVWIANPRRVPETSLAAFLRRLRQGPAGVPFGSAGNGTSTHLTGELVNQLAGLRMQHVPFRGAGPAMTAVVAGDIEVLFDNLPTAVPQIRAGTVRALAVTSPQRLPELPDVPTLAEAGAEFGLAGFEAEAWFGLSAHASASDAAVARLAAAAEAALANPEVRRQLAERGTTPQGGGPARYAALIAAERARWARVVREGNIQAD